MTVWGYPVVLWRFRRSCLTYAEHFTSIGFLDVFNDVIEKFLFGYCPFSSLISARRCLKMLFIEDECHCTKYDIHALLDGVLLRVDFRNIVKSDLQTRLPELPEFL